MRSKSSGDSALSSTDRQATRSSGTRSLGLDRWKAPEAMKRMWSVDHAGSVDRAAFDQRQQVALRPRGDIGAAGVAALGDLSISSMKTMPCCSTASRARALRSSSLSERGYRRGSTKASLIFSLAHLCPPMLAKRFTLVGHLLHAGRAMISTPAGFRRPRCRFPCHPAGPTQARDWLAVIPVRRAIGDRGRAGAPLEGGSSAASRRWHLHHLLLAAFSARHPPGRE